VAEQVFLDLTNELRTRGVKQNVIADMFGMALRTYHRRVRELAESKTDAGRSVWEAVLGYVRQKGPVSGHEVLRRFAGDDAEVVAGVLRDLAQTGLIYRAGRGDGARYRIAEEADFAGEEAATDAAREHLVWLSVYRNAPAHEETIAAATHLPAEACRTALEALIRKGRVVETRSASGVTYAADKFEVAVDAPNGWEAAVLDHFQAVVTAIIAKLSRGRTSGPDKDLVGGSTWSLDVWPGHPLEQEAKALLKRIRVSVEELRTRIDGYNVSASHAGTRERVVFYAGQNVRYLDDEESDST
jgi:DNA glycosylase AlkZ-like